jgi:hypothetical protein
MHVDRSESHSTPCLNPLSSPNDAAVRSNGRLVQLLVSQLLLVGHTKPHFTPFTRAGRGP